MHNNIIHILNVPFTNVTMPYLTEHLTAEIENNKKIFVVTANPEIVMHTRLSDEYMKKIQKADYIIADGIGIVKGAKIIGKTIKDRIPGIEVFQYLLHYGNTHQKSVYFLGATDEVLKEMITKVQEQYPNLLVVGSHHGYFSESDCKIVDDIKNKKADMVFVALGVPRQEAWISDHIDEFETGLFMGVGGSFDVLAERVKRAPTIFQKLHIEWLYRVMLDPFTRIPRLKNNFLFVKELFYERKKTFEDK